MILGLSWENAGLQQALGHHSSQVCLFGGSPILRTCLGFLNPVVRSPDKSSKSQPTSVPAPATSSQAGGELLRGLV